MSDQPNTPLENNPNTPPVQPPTPQEAPYAPQQQEAPQQPPVQPPVPPQQPYAPQQQQQQPPYGAPYQPVQPPAPIPGRGLAVAGLVCGILALVFDFCCTWIGIVLGILAIVFGFVARSKGMRNGMSTAAIICGFIAVFLFVILIILMAVGVFTLEWTSNFYDNNWNDFQNFGRFLFR